MDIADGELALADANDEPFDPDSQLVESLSNELGLNADGDNTDVQTPDEDTDSDEPVSTDVEPDDDPDPEQGAEAEVEREDDPEWEDVESDDTTYRVTVDGEHVEVTLDELMNGYQRQADYTRKTQDLASQRDRLASFERLDEALSEDPQGTLLALAQHLGVSLDPASAVDTPSSTSLDGYELDPTDPIEGELLRLRSLVETQATESRADRDRREAAERQSAIDREIEAVRVEFGDTQIDDLALLTYARDNQIGSLRHAFLAMQADESRRAEGSEVTRRLQRKRTAPPIEGGRNRNPAGFRQGSGSELMSLEESLAAAFSER